MQWGREWRSGKPRQPHTRCGLSLFSGPSGAGFPLDRLTQAESVVGFYCLGLHIGEPRSQNAKGHVVGQPLADCLPAMREQ